MPELRCFPCSNRVFKDESGYKAHCKSKKHRARVQASNLTQSASPRPPVPPTTTVPPLLHTSSISICTVCKQTFSTAQELKKHKSAHTTCKLCLLCIPQANYGINEHYTTSEHHPKCPICRLGLEDDATYQVHVRKPHTCTCPQCDLKFCKIKDVRRHYPDLCVKFSTIPRCPFCNISDTDPEILKTHIESNHYDQYCGQCNAVFLTEADNIRHHTTVHQTATKQVCVKDTQTEVTIALDESNTQGDDGATISMHIGGNKADIPPSTEGKIFCPTCRLFFQIDEMDDHFRLSSNHPTCDLCDLAFENAFTYTKHAFRSHPELCCDTCGLAFQDSSLRDEHYADSGMHTSCSGCNRGFKDQKSLQKHFEGGCGGNIAGVAAEPMLATPPLDLATPPLDLTASLCITAENNPSPTLSSIGDTSLVSPTPTPRSIQIPSPHQPTRQSINAPNDIAGRLSHRLVPAIPITSRLSIEAWRKGNPREDQDDYHSSSVPLRTSQRNDEAVNRDLLPTVQSIASSSKTAPQPPHKKARFNCRVCEVDPEEPVATICGHIFCLECLVERIKQCGKCPVCDSVMLLRLQV